MIKKLFSLDKEPALSGKIKNSAFVFTLFFFYCTALMHVLSGVFTNNLTLDTQRSIYGFLTACILAPCGEEFLFRVAPLALCATLFNNNRLLFIVSIASSIIFSYEHGDNIHFLIQGVFGMLLCWNYIKNQNYILNVLVHAAWNFTILYIIN